jgi:dihydrofolate reductase
VTNAARDRRGASSQPLWHVALAGLAAAAVELGLVDELRMFRNPVVVGGGTPFLPPVTEDIALEPR